MTSERKIEANRRNAARSTGPRSERGKSRVKFNALRHGLCAETIVLPHEDAQAYQNRLETWTADVNPRTDMEAYLVKHMVNLSWKLDRADAHEHASLIERIREKRGKDVVAAPVEMLMENLLLVPREAERLNVPLEDARGLIEQLEATAEGCQTLLEQWTGLWTFLARQQDGSAPPALPDESLVEFNRMTRLLGYTQTEAELLAIMDDRIKALYEIQILIDEEAIGTIRKEQDASPGYDPRVVARLSAEVWPLVDQRHRRLTLLLSEREKEEAVRGNQDSLAAFDNSIDGDRLHRYQDQWGRALGRTLRELRLAHNLTESGEAVETKPTSEPPGSGTQLTIHQDEPSCEPAPPPQPEPPRAGPVPAEQSHCHEQVPAPVRPCGKSKVERKASMPPRRLDLLGDDVRAVQPFSAAPASDSGEFQNHEGHQEHEGVRRSG